MRLQKYISQCGYCSRRKAEELIVREKVTVNGDIVKVLGTKIDPKYDIVRVNKQRIKQQEHVYFAVNKPVGYTSTTRFFKGEKNVTKLIPIKKRLIIVGRLDKDSQGLLLLTNDGEWANKIMHPKYRIEKEYLVTLNLPLSDGHLQLLQSGVSLDDGMANAIIARPLTRDKVIMVMGEGRKREVRRMFDALGYRVLKLERTRIGKLELGNMKVGSYRKIEPNDV